MRWWSEGVFILGLIVVCGAIVFVLGGMVGLGILWIVSIWLP